jgi:aminopeptidase N
MTPFILRRRFAAALLILAIALGSKSVLAETPVASPVADALEPVLPEYRAAFAETLNSIPSYEFDLTLDDAQSTISGSLEVTYPNETGTVIETVPFRLYPNAYYYGEGSTTIGALTVDGTPVSPRFDESETVLFVDLPQPLDPGDAVSIEMEFDTVVPVEADGSFGILTNDLSGRRFVLADWYPVVAGWDETGWRLEAPTEQGDPTFSATSLFDLRVAVRDGYEIYATGDETVLDDGTVHIVTGPVREFAMVVAENLTTLSAQAGETTISVHVDYFNEANGQHMLDIAVSALSFYNSTFGAYPFRELDLVSTDLALAYGVSWSGVLFIGETLLALSPDNLANLDFTIFHEVGHQWWGAAVGANSNDHTWMVEGLTNAIALLAQADIQGPQAAAISLYSWIVTPYANLLAGSGDAIADTSIFAQPPTAPLSTLAYGKGALGFLAIRNQIGDEAFRAALAAYADAFRLGIAEPQDLLAALEAASGQSLADIWTFWFESAQTTLADLDALVPQIIASL